MKPYPKYKPSDIQWLGDIPEHWEVKRLAVLGKFSKGGGISKADLTPVGVPAILYGDIYTKYEIFAQNILHKISVQASANAVSVSKNVILFTGSGETIEDIGKCIVNLYEDIVFVGGDVIIFEQTKNYSLYLSYVLNTNGVKFEKARYSKGGIIVHTYGSLLRNIRIPIPPIPEQTAIAQFLDEKTAQIDTLIAQKQRLISLLKEERMAFINEILSDKSFPLKKLKYVVEGKLEYGANESAELDDRSLPRYIRITDFGNNGKLKDETFKSLPFEKANEYLLKDGDILFARSGATVGKTFQFKNYEGIACFAGYLIKAMPNPKVILSDYLYYFTKSGIYENWKDSIFVQATIQNIGADKYNQLEIPVPPLKTQQKIVESIEITTGKIDATLVKIVQEIELLKEYRMALISEVVTGKISVI